MRELILELCVAMSKRVMGLYPGIPHSPAGGAPGCVLYLTMVRVPNLLDSGDTVDAVRWLDFAVRAAQIRGWL
jgi:hypothetical protein